MFDQSEQQRAVQKMVRKTLLLVVVAAFLLFLALFQSGKENRLTSPVQKQGISDSSMMMKSIMREGELGQQWQEGAEIKEKINLEQSKNLSSRPVVYAFLPYWNIQEEMPISEEITDLGFFRFLIRGNGLIMSEDENGDVEVGQMYWEGQRWKSILKKWQEKQPEGRLEVTFFQDDAEEIEALLLNEVNQDTLMTALHKFLKQNPQVKGINYDFEYYGVGGEAVQEGMTQLLRKTRMLIAEQHPDLRLTIDVFGRSGYKDKGLYNWPEVAKQVDYVILMAYDYKTRSSAQPGPVSPTLGKEVWGSDIFDSLRALLEKVPSYQVIMAVPFYGYQWETTSLDLAEAKTYPETGQTLTYSKIREMLGQAQDLGINVAWDEQSLTPYFTYEKDEKKFMTFYENEASLGYKMDLIKGMNLGGVAVWAVGYEGDHTEMWESIQQKLK